jgi:hypothetical protein
MVAAWFASDPSQDSYAAPALGAALVLCGRLASVTAIGRLIEGYRILVARQVHVSEPTQSAAPTSVSAPVPVPTAKAMRITGEHVA